MAKNPNFTEKTPTEIAALLKEKREELRTLRFSSATARTKDSNQASRTRKDVARLMTVLHQKKTA